MFPIRDPRNEPEFRFACQIDQTVHDLIQSVSVPVFAANPNALRRHNDILIVEGPPIAGIGSGTLFQIEEHHFLVTAAHVIEQFQEAEFELRLGMGDPVRPRPIALTENDVALDTNADVAVVRLPPNVLHMLADKRFLRLDGISFDVEVGDWYCVLFGYLWEGSQPGRDYTQLLLHNHKHWTRRYDGSVSASSYNPVHHLLVKYPESSWSLPNGVPVANPSSLGGISGASLWRIFRPQHVEEGWDLDIARVIAVENVVYDSRIVRCTRWRQVLPLLRELAPDVGTILGAQDDHGLDGLPNND